MSSANCIKCGREIPEGQLFCQECKLPSVVLPAEPAPEKKPKARKRPVQKKKKKKFDFARALRRTRIALLVFLLLFAALAVLVAVETNDYLSRKEHLRQREANVTLRENEANNRDARIAELEAENTRLQQALESALQTIQAQESN